MFSNAFQENNPVASCIQTASPFRMFWGYCFVFVFFQLIGQRKEVWGKRERDRERERQRKRERERMLSHSFMHSLVSSFVCALTGIKPTTLVQERHSKQLSQPAEPGMLFILCHLSFSLLLSWMWLPSFLTNSQAWADSVRNSLFYFVLLPSSQWLSMLLCPRRASRSWSTMPFAWHMTIDSWPPFLITLLTTAF